MNGMTLNSVGSIGTLTIKSVYFVGIPYGYQPMVRRPYILNNINSQNLKSIQNAFQNDRAIAGKVTPSTVATHLNNIVGLKAYGSEMNLIDMPNGWGGKRFRVIMVVEIQMGPRKKQYLIQGYTDHYGVGGMVSESSLDPEMTIFINSITEIDIVYSYAHNKFHFTMGETYNTLQDYVSKYEQNYNQSQLALIRPSDIMKANAVMNSNSYYNGESFDMPGSNLYGFGEYSQNITNTSLRKNADPSVYFSRLINGVISGQKTASTSYDDNSTENVFINGSQVVPEPVLANNLFITKLQEATSEYSPSTLKIKHLYKLDYTLPNTGRIQIFENDDYGEVTKFSPELGTITTTSTITPTPRNIQVLELNNSITSNLISVGLSSATFFIDTFTSVPTMTIMSGKSILGDEFVPECCETLKSLFYTQILPHFTRGGMYRYQIFVHSDIMKDTTISITEEGCLDGEREVFRFPTFADSLYSPMIATREDKSVLIKDFDTIYENIM